MKAIHNLPARASGLRVCVLMGLLAAGCARQSEQPVSAPSTSPAAPGTRPAVSPSTAETPPAPATRPVAPSSAATQAIQTPAAASQPAVATQAADTQPTATPAAATQAAGPPPAAVPAAATQPTTVLAVPLASASAATAPAAGQAATARPIDLVIPFRLDDTGLMKVLVEAFVQASGRPVRTRALAESKACRLGREGRADVLVLQADERTAALVAAGHAVRAVPFMHTDFVLLGPPANPAQVGANEPIGQALAKIAAAKATFVGVADGSAEGRLQEQLWSASGGPQGQPETPWYLAETHGVTRYMPLACDKQAYILVGREIYAKHLARWSARLVVVNEGDRALKKAYVVLALDGRKHPGVQAEGAAALEQFLVSAAAQKLIAEFRLNGQVVYRPGGP